MSDHVPVQPAPELRTEFARYVVAVDPYTRMVGSGVFAVRRDVFTAMPEPLLDGSLIGGTPYRSVSGEEPLATGGVVDAALVTVGETVPETYAPPVADTVSDAPAAEDDTAVADPLAGDQSPTHSGLHLCEDCGKVAATAAGLANHRRAKHPEES